MARLAIYAIMEKNHVLIIWKETGQDDNSEATRHGGLGCRSIPVCVIWGPIRCTSLSHVECSLTLSWPDEPFRPQSRVIQFRLGIEGSSAHSGGSKDVLGDIGIRPGGLKSLSPGRVLPLGMRHQSNPWFPKLYQRWPEQPSLGVSRWVL
jgi:hypothetical protein